MERNANLLIRGIDYDAIVPYGALLPWREL